MYKKKQSVKPDQWNRCEMMYIYTRVEISTNGQWTSQIYTERGKAYGVHRTYDSALDAHNSVKAEYEGEKGWVCEHKGHVTFSALSAYGAPIPESIGDLPMGYDQKELDKIIKTLRKDGTFEWEILSAGEPPCRKSFAKGAYGQADYEYAVQSWRDDNRRLVKCKAGTSEVIFMMPR